MLKILNKYLLKNVRYLSISKSNLVESSRNIQEILKITNDNITICKLFSDTLNNIHNEYLSNKIATSTKNLYQINSSKLNSIYNQIEYERKQQIGDFNNNKNFEKLIIHLRYIRYLEICFIYRLITYDINIPLKESINLIINLTKNTNYINSLTFICELTFFVYFLSSYYSLSYVKSLLSKTFINNYLLNYLFIILSQKSSLLLVNQICLTLYSVGEIPLKSNISLWSYKILNYLYNENIASLSIIKYLILIQHSSIQQFSLKNIEILNKYLNQTGIYQDNLYIICQLLILISSYNYSHELFHKNVIEKIRISIHKADSVFDMKLYCQLIYYLCLNDPINRFNTRSTIVELSKKVNENIDKETKYPQWIIQAQHGMMLLNIYNYQLLFSTLQQKFFPLLFRDLGVYRWSIQRQLFDIHYALSLDRPTLTTPLLNSQMLSFATKISDEYRSSIRPNQKSYNQFLIELKELFNNIYGNNTCQIIDTSKIYPYILFDFLEVNLPDTDELKSIGINTKQRIGVIPILNSMLIRQQRSNGSSIRVFNAHTSMRYRLIEKNNYRVLPIFHGEYLRTIRDNTFKTLFETNMALKSIPHQSDNDLSFHS